MSNIRKLPPELGMLLAALGIAKQISVEIDPDSPLSEDEQVQAAVDKAEAKHREECAGCREEYEREQVAAAAGSDIKPKADRRDGDADRRAGHTDRRGNKQPVGNAGRAAREFFGDKATGPASPPDRVLLGHIAYVGNVPVLGSFNRDEMAVKRAVIDFTNGVWDASIVVMPVFV